MANLAGEKILVVGAGGMLATEVIQVFGAAEADVVLSDAREISDQVAKLDITDLGAVQAVVRQYKPKWILNCAAYTKVDDAETHYGLAIMVNSEGPKNLAVAARESGANLVHISSDYVYGANNSSRRKPYSEDDEKAPCGIYGYSKHLGDEFVRHILPDSHIILRTSWLHGTAGPNFVDTMLRLGQEKDSLKIVHDQFGSPTWAPWLAEVALELVSRDARGVFNVSSRGGISWFDFAQEIFSCAGIEIDLATQTTEELGRPAPRPAYSTLAVDKLEKFLGRDCPSWQSFVEDHINAVGGK